MDEDRISATSGVNQEGKPFVHYEWVGDLRKCQWTPEEARQHALSLLATADAAESDAAVFQLLTERMELEPPAAAAFLGDMRNFRRSSE